MLLVDLLGRQTAHGVRKRHDKHALSVLHVVAPANHKRKRQSEPTRLLKDDLFCGVPQASDAAPIRLCSVAESELQVGTGDSRQANGTLSNLPRYRRGSGCEWTGKMAAAHRHVRADS